MNVRLVSFPSAAVHQPSTLTAVGSESTFVLVVFVVQYIVSIAVTISFMRGTLISQVSVYTAFHHFGGEYLLSMSCPCFGSPAIFVLWGTTVYGMCKLTALSVNHAGKYSKDCFRGAMFVDTPTGKLDMWLCMAEPVQLNLSKME